MPALVKLLVTPCKRHTIDNKSDCRKSDILEKQNISFVKKIPPIIDEE